MIKEGEECTECEGHGWVVEVNPYPVCCQNFTAAGDCCNYPVPDYQQEQVPCEKCKGTGSISIDQQSKG